MELSKTPPKLKHDPVELVFVRVVTLGHHVELVPYYHFKIRVKGEFIGHINLRIGATRHVEQFAGHVGFNVLEKFRGNNFSYYACLALQPFIKEFYRTVILTADPDNKASIRILEKLAAQFLEEVEVPESDPAYAGGARLKRRYLWSMN